MTGHFLTPARGCKHISDLTGDCRLSSLPKEPLAATASSSDSTQSTCLLLHPRITRARGATDAPLSVFALHLRGRIPPRSSRFAGENLTKITPVSYLSISVPRYYTLRNIMLWEAAMLREPFFPFFFEKEIPHPFIRVKLFVTRALSDAKISGTLF